MPIPYSPAQYCRHCHTEMVKDGYGERCHLSTAQLWCDPADCRRHDYKRVLNEGATSLTDFTWVCRWCHDKKAKGELETHMVRGVEVPK